MAVMVSSSLAQEAVGAKQYLLEAKAAFDAIASYHCTATNVVMKYGLLRPTRYFNTVQYSFQKPNRVRMTWLAPGLLKGQVAVYKDSALAVKMRFMPFAIKMNPEGLLAQDPAGNRIHKTHIGYLLDTLLEAITPETRVAIVDNSKFQSVQPGMPVEVVNDEGRVLVLLDRARKLPISMEFYGPDGRLKQACYFEDLKLDVVFGAEEFDIATKSS